MQSSVLPGNLVANGRAVSKNKVSDIGTISPSLFADDCMTFCGCLSHEGLHSHVMLC